MNSNTNTNTWTWQRAVKWLHQVGRSGTNIRYDKQQQQSDFLQYAITALQYCADADGDNDAKGFDKDTLQDLFNTWLKLKIPSKLWNAIGLCLVPRERVDDELVKQALNWVFTNCWKEDETQKVLGVLHWISALMEANLFDTNILDLYYDFFFFQLNCEKICIYACKFLHKFTKPHDVTRTRVLHILSLIKQKQQPRFYNAYYAVLGVYKSFNPECVPENIPSVSANVVFPKISPELSERLYKAQVRCSINNCVKSEDRLLWWDSVYQGSTKKASVHLIPDLVYIRTSSTLYSKTNTNKTCLDFLSIQDLRKHHLISNIEIPCNILSLFVNDAGLHMIVFSDKNYQSQFSQTLYHILFNNFLKQRSNLSYEEKKYTLQRIALLQQKLMQGIPVVSRFLAQYIFNWNGLDFFDEILSLLEWISFESFEELFVYILEYIESLFFTNDSVYCCMILKTLKNLYINIHTTSVSNINNLFLNRSKKDSNVDILNNLSDFIDYLCKRSINTTPDNPILRNAFLEVYGAISEIQLKSPHPIWTVLPVCLACNVLCSMNAYQIDKILGIFLNYRLIYDRIKSEFGKETIRTQMTLIDCYHFDFINSLWFGKSVSQRKEGLMLKALPSYFVDILSIKDADKLLDIKHHCAFAPYMIEMSPEVCISMDEQQYLEDIIAPNFKNIHQFINIVLAKSN